MITPPKSFIFIIFLFTHIFLPTNAAAGDSVIESAIKARRSIVHIFAFQTQFFGSARASALLDPASGKMLIARNMKTLHAQKMGAGVIIDPAGMVVTNLHTVKFATELAVVLHDGTVLSGKILHLLPEHDLVLVKIDPPSPLEAIPFADSDAVQLGDAVINIGSSELLKETISGGRITRLGTIDTPDGPKVELIQVNIDLYKGDSGGPLLNREGALIGMIAAKLKNQNKATLAIPANKIKILCSEHLP